MRRRVPGLLGVLVIGSIAAACGSVASPVASTAPRVSSSPAAPVSAAPPSPSPSAASDEPPWATALGRAIGCDGPPARMGAVASPTDGDGSWVADQPDGVLDGFLAGAARSYGFLPLDGWEVVVQLDRWILAAHVVDGRPRAVASFTAGTGAKGGGWILWQVAACDASEFADDTAITFGLVRWTDASGGWAPTTTVRDSILCSEPARRLRVDGREFVREPDGWLPPDRLLGMFETGVDLPADARPTTYREGQRRIWIAADGTAAYVGAPGSLERWPRVRDDDASVTDCN